MTTNGDIPITPRQLELLAALCSGLSTADAAKKLYIAERTAYNVLRLARKKAGAGSNEHLVVIAFREGWLEIDGEGVAAPAAAFQS